MPNLKPMAPATADAGIAASLAAVKAKLGSVPNMFLTLANTPVALNGYLHLSAATATGKLNAKQREAIALAIHFKAPVLVSRELLEKAGQSLDAPIAPKPGERRL